VTTTEAEVTAVHAPGTAIATYAAGQVEEYRPRIVMASADAKALDDQLRAMQLAILRKGVDYDTIPGMGDRPTLLKPGAEKLLQWFGFGFTCERDETERDADGQRLGVTYRCTVTKGLPGGGQVTVATCEGYAGYDEERFFQTAEQARAKAEANERKWASKDNRPPRAWKWENATGHRAPWNTVIKMSQKRALVGAAIDATAAAGLFTQDLEDMPQPANGNDDAAAAGDDAWEKSTPAPRRQNRPDGNGQPASGQAENGQRWAENAIAQAAGFKSEAEGQALWRESAAAVIDGRATPGEATHIQNLITARVTDRRKEAMEQLLQHLSEDDEWRDQVRGLTSDDEAREAVEELGRLKAAGTMNETRAGRIAAAIVARYPKAVLRAGDDGD
jgi:hypothetical protein